MDCGRGRLPARLVAGVLLVAACALAQPLEPVHWSAQADPPAAAPGSRAMVRVVARIDPGWHLYAPSSPSGIPISFQVGPDKLVERVRLLSPPPRKVFDQTAGANAEIYEGEAAFLVEVTLRQDAPTGAAGLMLAARYQVCSDARCIPGKWTAIVALHIDPAAPAPAPANPRRLFRRGAAPAVPGANRRWLGGLRAGGVRLRPGLHFHALRVSHDPHHHVVLPQPPLRRAARRGDAGRGLLPGHRGAVHQPGPGGRGDPRPSRR